MRSLIAKIAAVLKSMPRMVWEHVCVAGALVWRLIAKPAEQAYAEDLPAVHEAETPPPGAGGYDLEMANVRTVAAHLRSGFTPPTSMCAELDERTAKWLAALPMPMLDIVVKADQDALREHVRGRKSIRGLLIVDEATVAEYGRRAQAPVPSNDEKLNWGSSSRFA